MDPTVLLLYHGTVVPVYCSSALIRGNNTVDSIASSSEWQLPPAEELNNEE